MLNQTQQAEYDKGYYDRMVEQFKATHGELTAAADVVIRRAAQLELLVTKAMDDIDAKGLRETVRNGKQTFQRDNKSLMQLLKITGQQTSLLQAVKLLPSRRPSFSPDGDNEDGDEEDELKDF